MDTEQVVACVLAAALVGVAAIIARSQLRTVRIARLDEHIGPEDRRYLGNQARRRLLEAALMVVLAALLVGWLFLEQELQSVREQVVDVPPHQHPIVRIVTVYWIFACLVLFLMLVLAGFDFIATAKFALRHQRRIQDERNAMLASEVSRLRDKHASNGQGRMNGEL